MEAQLRGTSLNLVGSMSLTHSQDSQGEGKKTWFLQFSTLPAIFPTENHLATYLGPREIVTVATLCEVQNGSKEIPG